MKIISFFEYANHYINRDKRIIDVISEYSVVTGVDYDELYRAVMLHPHHERSERQKEILGLS